MAKELDEGLKLGVAAGFLLGAFIMTLGFITLRALESEHETPPKSSWPNTVIIPGIDRCDSFNIRTTCHVKDTWDFIYVKEEK